MAMEHMQSSFISKLPIVMETIGEKKEQLAAKKQELLEIKRIGGGTEQLTYELGIQWGTLEVEINLLEHTANVMKKDLIQRGLLVNGKL
ncbi:hypothetical protein Lser_V15G19333 [Lactuca serriola]